MTFPPVEVIVPSVFKTKIHMLKVKPPSRQPSPSVKSVNFKAAAPRITAGANAATKYAPCVTGLIGGLQTYTRRT